MTPTQQLYDFETPVEGGLALALAALNVSTYVVGQPDLVKLQSVVDDPALGDRLLDPVSFQKKRPRVEIEARTGAAEGVHYPELDKTPVGGICHDQAHLFSVTLSCITEPNITAHREYVTIVRAAMATIVTDANATGPLTLHAIQELNDSGSSRRYKTTDGSFQTDIIYTGRITMQEDAVEAVIT